MSKVVRIFISAVSDEFKSYRDELTYWLERRPNVKVEVQEKFIATGNETLEMLDDYIKDCDAVVHFVGDMSGAYAKPNAFTPILKSYSNFLTKVHVLEGMLGSGAPPISYTQWEGYLALYHDATFIIVEPNEHAPRDPKYLRDDAQSASQKEHSERLRAMLMHGVKFDDKNHLVKEMLASTLHDIVGTLPSEDAIKRSHSRFGQGAVSKLKHLLLSEAKRLREEKFIFTAFVQINGSIDPGEDPRWRTDSVLIDKLAERKLEHELLALAHFCESRARALGMDSLSTQLGEWLTAAMSECGVTLEEVRAECFDALEKFDAANPPAPRVEIAWKDDDAVAHGVRPAAHLRWGRCTESLLRAKTKPMVVGDVVSSVVDRLEDELHFSDVAPPMERLEVFVASGESEDLNCPWEVRPNAVFDDDEVLHPWPITVRLMRKRWERQQLKTPPERFAKGKIACLIGMSPTFVQDARRLGAFFAAWCDAEGIDSEVLARAVSRAGVGCWLRSVNSPASAARVLEELIDVPLPALPGHVHQKRERAASGSEWRKVSVLYDLPDMPSFEFINDVQDHESALQIQTQLT